MLGRKLYKTKLCTLFQKGRYLRQNCNFAHGDAELRRFGGSFNGEHTVGDSSSEFLRWKNGGGLFHRSARIHPTAVVEVGAVVHSDSELASDVHIGFGTVIGTSVSVGCYTKIWYNAVLSNCCIGQFSTIHNGVCIGQDGFGFYVDEEGRVVKKPQVLNVKIGDHVEIGGNTCIDRGRMGDYVTLGGRVAVRDHVSIASKVRLAANSCVTKDLVKSGDYGGFPAVPIHEWRRQSAKLRVISRTP